MHAGILWLNWEFAHHVLGYQYVCLAWHWPKQIYRHSLLCIQIVKRQRKHLVISMYWIEQCTWFAVYYVVLYAGVELWVIEV